MTSDMSRIRESLSTKGLAAFEGSTFIGRFGTQLLAKYSSAIKKQGTL